MAMLVPASFRESDDTIAGLGIFAEASFQIGLALKSRREFPISDLGECLDVRL
jgi:hypothetical protein